MLLTVAAAANAAALVVPFLDLDMVGSGSEPYGLFRTVGLLWESGLFALAVLVVGFSAVFPFVKLAVLWSCTRRGPATGRTRRLALVESLGKWSMLDALLVAILLALTKGQWLVSAEPRWGIALFVGGIVLSMAAGAVIAAAWPHPAPPAAPVRPPPSGGSHAGRWVLAAVAGLALLGAQVLPTLEIDSFWLRSHSYSLIDMTWAMATQGSWSLAILLALGCIVLPWLRWAALVLALVRPGSRAAHRCFTALGPWTLVDVFALALAIFLLEGSAFVPTGTGPGAALLATFLVLHLLARMALARTVRQAKAPPEPHRRLS